MSSMFDDEDLNTSGVSFLCTPVHTHTPCSCTPTPQSPLPFSIPFSLHNAKPGWDADNGSICFSDCTTPLRAWETTNKNKSTIDAASPLMTRHGFAPLFDSGIGDSLHASGLDDSMILNATSTLTSGYGAFETANQKPAGLGSSLQNSIMPNSSRLRRIRASEVDRLSPIQVVSSCLPIGSSKRIWPGIGSVPQRGVNSVVKKGLSLAQDGAEIPAKKPGIRFRLRSMRLSEMAPAPMGSEILHGAAATSKKGIFAVSGKCREGIGQKMKGGLAATAVVASPNDKIAAVAAKEDVYFANLEVDRMRVCGRTSAREIVSMRSETPRAVAGCGYGYTEERKCANFLPPPISMRLTYTDGDYGDANLSGESGVDLSLIHAGVDLAIDSGNCSEMDSDGSFGSSVRSVAMSEGDVLFVASADIAPDLSAIHHTSLSMKTPGSNLFQGGAVTADALHGRCNTITSFETPRCRLSLERGVKKKMATSKKQIFGRQDAAANVLKTPKCQILRGRASVTSATPDGQGLNLIGDAALVRTPGDWMVIQSGLTETPKAGEFSENKVIFETPEGQKFNQSEIVDSFQAPSLVSNQRELSALMTTPEGQTPRGTVAILNTPKGQILARRDDPLVVMETPKHQILDGSLQLPSSAMNDLKLRRSLRTAGRSVLGVQPTTSTATKALGAQRRLGNRGAMAPGDDASRIGVSPSGTSLKGGFLREVSLGGMWHSGVSPRGGWLGSGRKGEGQLGRLSVQANVNPFTLGRKRHIDQLSGSMTSLMDSTGSSSDSADELPSSVPPLKRASGATYFSTRRLSVEFQRVRRVGAGHFGTVYEVTNRLDGCTYAIKKSKYPVAATESGLCSGAMNEVYAHAALRRHPNLVTYYSSWVERGHIFIQTEFCNGGSLWSLMVARRAEGGRELRGGGGGGKEGGRFGEGELRDVLEQIAAGLRCMHASGLVHLDVKPENILIAIDPVRLSPIGQKVGRFDPVSRITYKLGDFGQVRLSTAMCGVEEGDCRYLPLEVLQDRLDDLPKADVFSLALTLFEMGTLRDLPKNGPLWQQYRAEGLPELPLVSARFNAILRAMSNPIASVRPTAASLCSPSYLAPRGLGIPSCRPPAAPSTPQLVGELGAERQRASELQREIAQLKSLGTRGRSVGGGCRRSHSLVLF